jgi:multidrug efflux pump subunit AcrA (membrane-fusion protein)
MELDDSALQDGYRAQSIVVEKAKAEWVTADENFVITAKQNLSDIATADAAQDVAALDLDKFLGLRADPALDPLGGLAGPLVTLAEKGDYQRRLDEASGLLKIAEADLEQYRDRAAWSERSVRLGYQTPSQARAEQSKLSGALENAEKLRKQKAVLEAFDRKKELTQLNSNLEVATLNLDRATRQAKSKEVQAESTRKTAYSVYMQELEKLREIEEQIRQCKIFSPQDGMCVYYKDAGGRWGNSTEGQIIQGAQVKEGQKLLRIPDLKRMQVNTKVHEAMVSRIRGDDRQSTGFYDTLRAGLLANPHPFSRLMGFAEGTQSYLREAFRDKEYYLASPGQAATVRIDAFPDRVLKGHVRTVAAVASQQDWMSSDVKVYQTLVTIDEELPGLKPDMSAEVTIQVDPGDDRVLAVPIQAVVGGAEAGGKRKVYVSTPAGPQEREVQLGLFNEKMVEVREGLAEGDRVVLNPKVLLGPAAKTREESAEPAARRPGMGGKGGEGKKGGKTGGGMKGGGGGPPAGGGMKQ